MKKMFVAACAVMVLLGTILLSSCNQDSDINELAESQVAELPQYSLESIENQLALFHSETSSGIKATPKWWLKIKKWFKDHSGTYLFQSCSGSNPCGPCAGLCLGSGRAASGVPSNYTLTQQDKIDGIDLFSFTFITDTTAVITFKNSSSFVHSGNFYLDQDYDFGGGVAKEFKLKSVVMKKGVYPVSFSNDPNGETVVQVQVSE
jgi:hypothetical protein